MNPITLLLFLRLSLRSLLRGGQRVFVAFLCIAFGILALVSLTMLAKSIESAVAVTPTELVGGELVPPHAPQSTLRPADVDQLNALQQGGALSRYTLIALNSSIMFHAPGSGEMHFVTNGMGIEPQNYPLAGSLTIGEPSAAALPAAAGSLPAAAGSLPAAAGSLPALLQHVGDVILTRDVAERFHLKIGDPIILADLHAGVPVPGAVRGIAYDTPNHRGDKLYYSLETAQKLAGGRPVANTVIANTADPSAAIAQLESSGWSVEYAAAQRAGNPGNAWVIGLRGAGILGLLVAGIGIANTMQVLLRRRLREIAIWKTLGYRAGDLRLIFMLEAGLLGLAGSLPGAALGVLLSTGMLEIFRRASSLLYQWTFSPTPPLLGILVGTLATLIFAAWAIVITSQARPVTLLRGEPLSVQGSSGCQSAGLALFLAVPLTALASLVMGSLLAGIGVLILIVIGIACLGGFFSAVLWLCTRVLPLRRFPLARMAFTSLRRRRAGLVFAMIALFIGVLSMSLGLAVTQFSELKTSGMSPDFQSYNLDVLAPAGQADAARQAIQAQRPEKLGVGYRAALAGLSIVGGTSEPVTGLDAVLVGRSDPEDYIVEDAGSFAASGSKADPGSRPDGVYVYKGANLRPGTQLTVTFRDGASRTFTVLGAYDINYRSPNLAPPAGLLMPADAFARVARPDTVTYFARFAPNRLDQASAALAASLPQATVVNLVDYAGRFMQSYRSLYFLPIILAGLAHLAGLLLVANAVSLTMLDRRYEIGVLKAIGYARRQVLTMYAIEYGLVGLLATAAGVLFIQSLLAVLALTNRLSASLLLLSLPSLSLVFLFGVGLTLLTVLWVAWGPTRVSPVAILSCP